MSTPSPGQSRKLTAGELLIRTSIEGDQPTLALYGELDLGNSDRLTDELEQVISSSDTVLLDFRGLTFIDSGGIRALMRARRECGEVGCRVLLRLGRARVRRTLEMTGLLDLFSVVD